MDLCGGFDEVLQVGAGQEVTEVDKLAVCLILDCPWSVLVTDIEVSVQTIDDTPLGLATTDVLAIHDDGAL